MRTVKPPEERRQEILDGAIRVFARNGYDKASISDIANELGISQGLCYRYFPSKEAIYDAAIDEYAEFIVHNNLNKAHFAGKPLKEQIRMMSGNMSEYTTTEKDSEELYTLFHQPGSRKLHDELFLKVAEKLVPVIASILRGAKARGEVTISDPDATAYFFVYGQLGILMNRQIPEEEQARRIQDCLIELLQL
jgi:AcrR family transcriptional regulator